MLPGQFELFCKQVSNKRLHGLLIAVRFEFAFDNANNSTVSSVIFSNISHDDSIDYFLFFFENQCWRCDASFKAQKEG